MIRILNSEKCLKGNNNSKKSNEVLFIVEIKISISLTEKGFVNLFYIYTNIKIYLPNENTFSWRVQ